MSVKIGGDKAVRVPLVQLKDAAARPKCNSSATATKYLRWRISIGIL